MAEDETFIFTCVTFLYVRLSYINFMQFVQTLRKVGFFCVVARRIFASVTFLD